MAKVMVITLRFFKCKSTKYKKEQENTSDLHNSVEWITREKLPRQLSKRSRQNVFYFFKFMAEHLRRNAPQAKQSKDLNP